MKTIELRVKIEITKKDFDAFLRLPMFRFKNGVYQYATNSFDNTEKGWAKREKETAFCERLTVAGLLGFTVTSWGMQEHEYFLTSFGKEVKAKYSP